MNSNIFEKLFINMIISLFIFFILTSPHILYMMTYDVDYNFDSGNLIKYESTIGFPYNMISIILCSISSIILGRLVTNEIVK